MIRRRLLSLAVPPLLVLLLGTAYAVGPHERTGDPVVAVATAGGTIRVASCVIRWEAHPTSTQGRSRPYIYRNSTHPCPGIKSVWTDWTTGYLMIAPAQSWAPILHFNPQPDETLTRLDIDAGASVGAQARVLLARGGKTIRADDPLFLTVADSANLWVLALSLDGPASTIDPEAPAEG